MMSDLVSGHIVSNLKILSLLAEPDLSKRLYSALLNENGSIVKSLAEIIYNASSEVFSTSVKFKKQDLKLLTKGHTKKKRALLATPYYRKSVVPPVCAAALKFLDNGGS